MAEQGGDGLESHAAVDRLGGEGVPEPVRVDARDARSAGDPCDDAGDGVAVQGAAVVGGQPLVPADVLEVGGGPGGEQRGQLGVQRDVPVVAELAERDAQPVGGADEDDRVGFQAGELAGPHPGPGQQFQDEPVAGVGGGPGGAHQPGRVAVVEELRQGLGLFRDVPGDHGVAGRGVWPVPLDDPLEELADGPHPLPVGLFRDRPACAPGAGGQPHFEVLDVIAADLADRPEPGLFGHPAAGAFVFAIAGLGLLGAPDTGHAFDVHGDQDFGFGHGLSLSGGASPRALGSAVQGPRQ